MLDGLIRISATLMVRIRNRLLENCVSDHVIHVAITVAFQKQVEILLAFIVERIRSLNGHV